MQVWSANADEISLHCTDLKLWQSTNSLKDQEQSNVTDQVRYWLNETAFVASSARQVMLLIGLLSFANGYWRLTDRVGFIECIITGRQSDLHHHFQGRIIFADKFVVHRETFTLDSVRYERTYLSLDAADIRIASSPLTKLAISSRDVDKSFVQFLLLNKSMFQMNYIVVPSKRHAFSYLLNVSLLQTHPIGAIDSAIFFCEGQTLLASYPSLVEGNVYQLHIQTSDILKEK